MRNFFWVMLLVAGTASAGPATRETEPTVAPQAAVAAQAIPAPFAEEQALLDALRMNDFRALLETKMSPREAAHMEEQWKSAQENFAKKAAEAKADPKLIEIEAVWAKLQTPAGVDALVAEWQPKLAAEAKSQITQYNLGLAMMLTAIAEDRHMTIEQTAMMRDLVLAVQKWANDTDFEDPQRLRRAIEAFAVEARRTGLESPADLFALSLDEALVHGDAAMRAAKQALRAYDIDADATLDSVRLTVLERNGAQARVRYEARVLGVGIRHEQELRLFKDSWIESDIARQMEEWELEHSADTEAAERARRKRTAPATAPTAD